MLVVEGESGGEDALAVGGDSVSALVWDFGYESVAAEFDDESGDSGASPVGFAVSAADRL